MHSAARHRCMIYADAPEQQLPYVASILTHELRDGARCVYLHSPDMIAAFTTYLSRVGTDVDAAIRTGALVLSPDRGHLSGGHFDAEKMLTGLTTLAHQALADGYEKLWVTGDMTWEFDNHVNFTELIQYERNLEHLFQQYPILNGICQYHQDTLPTSALRDALCTHQTVYLNQTLFRLNPYFSASTPQQPSRIPTDIKDLIERFHQHQ